MGEDEIRLIDAKGTTWKRSKPNQQDWDEWGAAYTHFYAQPEHPAWGMMSFEAFVFMSRQLAQPEDDD